MARTGGEQSRGFSLGDWSRPGDLEQVLPFVRDRFRLDYVDPAEIIEATGRFYEYPNCDREPLPRWSFDRVSLLGDEAHPMYPVGSNGASQAILDAHRLARCLSMHDTIEAALMKYDDDRWPATEAIVLANRRGGPEGVIDLVEARAPDGFLIVSLLISAAVVPITLLPSRAPADVAQDPVAFRNLFSTSPLAAAGVFLAGLAIGGFWGMGANFAQRIGLDVAGISAFMAAVLGGTLLLQWPLGWVFDRMPRNLITAVAAAGSAAAAIGMAMTTEAPLPVLLTASVLFGGFGIPIYSLCVAFANDDISPGKMLGTARGLLLLNGLGTAAGPFIGGLAMNAMGPSGLFIYAAALLALLGIMAIPSPWLRPDRKASSARCPHTPLITLSLDALLQQKGD